MPDHPDNAPGRAEQHSSVPDMAYSAKERTILAVPLLLLLSDAVELGHAVPPELKLRIRPGRAIPARQAPLDTDQTRVKLAAASPGLVVRFQLLALGQELLAVYTPVFHHRLVQG